MSTHGQLLEYLINETRSRHIIDHEKFTKLLTDIGLEPRLIEELQSCQDLNEVLEEFLNQCLIWIDDDSGHGNVYWLKQLLRIVNDSDNLMLKCDQLGDSIVNKNERKEILLQNGIKSRLENDFNILGWLPAKDFLTELGTVSNI